MKSIVFLISVFAHASPSPPEIPETVVKISIFDLINRPPATPAKPAYQLPKDYGQKVAALVLSKKAELTECISSLNSREARYKLELSIDPAGKGNASAGATVLGETRQAAECVQNILGELEYPPHKLSRAVTVEFPLLLQKRVL